MQYILTQQEYDALRDGAKQRRDQETRDLQWLCTQAAMHIPVPGPNEPVASARPWGCILEPSHLNPIVCDDCPAKAVCPHDGKEWSQ